MRAFAGTLTLILALLAPAAALAYVGPGAGLSLLGALWALIAALGVALIFIVAWPLRRLLRRRRGQPPTGEAEPSHAPGMAGAPAEPRQQESS